MQQLLECIDDEEVLAKLQKQAENIGLMSAQVDPDARKKLAELEEEKQWQDRAKEATEVKQQEKQQKMIEKK